MPGVFTGIAGQDTAFGLEAPDWDTAQATASEEQWKRMTYPAGRILHLVPSYLVQGETPLICMPAHKLSGKVVDRTIKQANKMSVILCIRYMSAERLPPPQILRRDGSLAESAGMSNSAVPLAEMPSSESAKTVRQRAGFQHEVRLLALSAFAA